MNLYIVESKVMPATSIDALWRKIKKNYFRGCVVTIENDTSRKVFVR